MDYIYRKDKLPAGYSFPIGKSSIDELLLRANVRHIHAIYYFRRTEGDIALRADYLGEEKHNWVAAGHSSITVYSVPAEHKRVIAQWIQLDVFPRLIRWLQHAEQAGNVWRDSSHSISFHYNHGITAISEQ